MGIICQSPRLIWRIFFFDGKSPLYWSKTYDVACKFIVYWLAFSFLYSLNKTAVETIFTRIQPVSKRDYIYIKAYQAASNNEIQNLKLNKISRNAYQQASPLWARPFHGIYFTIANNHSRSPKRIECKKQECNAYNKKLSLIGKETDLSLTSSFWHWKLILAPIQTGWLRLLRNFR